MTHSILKSVFVSAIVLSFTFVATEPAQAGSNCGGLNQKSCWNVNPKKWCDGNLVYKGNGKPGQGRCVKRTTSTPRCGGLNQKSCWNANPAKWCRGNLQYKPTGVPGQGTCVKRTAKSCGGLNQSSCWNVNPTKWCSGNLKYKPTGIPGKGTCIARVEDGDLKDVAAPIARRIKNAGQNNPLASLRSCLKRPKTFARLQDAMQRRSKNGVNAVLASCGVSPQSLSNFGNQMLGFTSGNSARSTRSVNGMRNSSQSSGSGKSWNLSIAVVGSAVAYGGVEGAIGYHLTLRSNPEARFYVAGGLAVGVGASAGVDLAIGIGYETMPTGHWARSTGVSVSYSGKAVYGGGVSIDFPTDSAVPVGFTASGGAGAGAEVGVVTGTLAQYLYNF